mgnify:CR=1 FL=1
MDRNAPCPCGSEKKFKKCHGAAVPPEAAALPAAARAEWLRGDVVLQRQKRVGQELLDWAEKKLTAEWIDKSLDAWGMKEDEDVDEGVADLFTTWSLFNYEPTSLGKTVAAAWLDDAAGKRADRSEEHTSELQSLMRRSYAVFCLKKKNARGRGADAALCGGHQCLHRLARC